MDNRDIILNELREISPLIATLSNHNIYWVPDDYFEMLSNEVFISIAESQCSKSNPFTVPQGYFDILSSAIISQIKMDHEIELDERFKDLSSNQLYEVPHQYFDSLADNILHKIKLNSSKSSASEELESVSPLLSGISKENVLSIPVDYFETIDPFSNINANKKGIKAQPVFSLKSKWISYAAAASVAALLFVGAYLFANKPIEHAIITSVDIARNRELKKTNIEKSLASLSDDEINTYLISEVKNSVYENTGNESYDPDVQSLLESASDDEIQQYLESSPEVVNIHS